MQRENIINNAQLKKDASDAAKEKAKELKAQNEQAKKEKKSNDATVKQAEEQAAKEQLELTRKVQDLTYANITDADEREKAILDAKHRRELEDLKTQYGAKKEFIELEKQLKIQQGIDQQALTDKIKKKMMQKTKKQTTKKLLN